MAENPHLEALRKRVASASTGPGIYRWKNDKGDVLYVGKAKNLRKRLAQYVNPGKGMHGPWRQAFLRQIADFDMTVAGTELEALLLETNLIKELKPKYNVLMKDDKHYLYITISAEEYPRVSTARRMQGGKISYYGPYLNGEDVRVTLELLHEALGHRACRESLDALNRGVPAPTKKTCLEHQIGKCNGLCLGFIDRTEYLRRMDDVHVFLKGNHSHVRGILETKMKEAASARKFESAARLRNELHVLDRLEGKSSAQLASDTTGEDSDVFGVAVLSNRAHVVVLKRRGGRIVDETAFELAGEAEDAQGVLSQFLPQFYEDEPLIPSQVLLPVDLPDKDTLQEWLTMKRRDASQQPFLAAVRVIIPERGRKSHLIQLAEKNAREKARLQEVKWESEKANTEAALDGLQRLLNLPVKPLRIEGYDISHLGGTETVGSMVVMKNGKTANKDYRSFTIRTMKAGVVDDYRALKEVLKRRLRRFCEDLPEEERKWKEQGVTFGKARKADALPAETTVVARKDDTVIAHGGLKKIDGVTVLDHPHKDALNVFLIRKILRSVKKGKVYVVVPAEKEETYGELGFRYVIKPPKGLTTDGGNVVMMWEAHQNKPDASLSAKPDLIVIDGGKGQLSAVTEVMESCALDIPVIGLAKREEEVFVPDNPVPVIFPKDSPAKFLLMRLRDEAHRFANRHREKRLKTKTFASALDTLPGIGEKTKEELLKKFGTVNGIKNATDDELASVVSEEQMHTLRKHLS
jgi:excinuclease ABC subunit C